MSNRRKVKKFKFIGLILVLVVIGSVKLDLVPNLMDKDITPKTKTSIGEVKKANNSEENYDWVFDIDDNTPKFSESEKSVPLGYESYSDLDSLGRCGVAFARVGKDTMPTEKRGSIGMVKPSGWHTVRYDDLIAGKYLYNRCHLIAFELAGENANEKNLVTGTRWMNVSAMLLYENKVAKYCRDTGNSVLYKVTPIFIKDDLLCSGVLMEAESVEDGGSGVKFKVYCPNIQKGVHIDYSTGESWRR